MQLAFKLPAALTSAASATDADAAARNAQALSAWMDDEGAGCAQAFLISDAGRATWDTYHLIGDVLRTPDLAIAPTAAFSARLADALAAESAHDAVAARPTAPARSYARFAWPTFLPGLALAAALALVVWMARPFLMNGDAPMLAEVQAGGAPNGAPKNAPDSAAVAGLNNYLDAHRQLVGPGVVRQVSWGSAGFRDVSIVRTGAPR